VIEATCSRRDAASVLFNLPGYRVLEAVDSPLPVAGPVLVLWRRRRFICAETACGRRTFAEDTAQVPFRARCTTRLRQAALDARHRCRRRGR